MPRSSPTNDGTPTSDAGGSATGNGASACSCPTSPTSDAPASGSSGSWRTPASVKELAAQATEVGTMLLNGTLPLETAKAYSALARSVAQLVSAEVARARVRREEPDLRLNGGK